MYTQVGDGLEGMDGRNEDDSADTSLPEEPQSCVSEANISDSEVNPDNMLQGGPSANIDQSSLSAMDQSTCSDQSYVKCERPSPQFHRVESGSDLHHPSPSEFRYTGH